MNVYLTVPIVLGDDRAFVTEFEAMVELNVTHRGTSRSAWDAGSAPEFTVDVYWLDLRKHIWDDKPGLKGRWVHDLRPAPQDLIKYIDDYLDNGGMDDVIEALEEEETV